MTRCVVLAAALAAAWAQTNECTDPCADCQHNFCWGETQMCVEPNTAVAGDWYCKCVSGAGENVGRAVPTCGWDECAHPESNKQAVCGTGQQCNDPAPYAPTLGASGAAIVVADARRLRHGEGDCDADADCAEGFYCMFRKDGKLQVPGVDVSALPSDVDVCAFPFVMPYVWHGDDPAQLLGIGEGDCDHDGQCQPGLKCWMRGAVRRGRPAIQEYPDLNPDFCYKEAEVVASPSGPLGIGQGNCNSDADCMAGLHCFYRQPAMAWFPVPGIDIDNLPVDVNICYKRPDTAARGTASFDDWTCACTSPATGATVTARAATCAAPPTAIPPTPAPATPIPPTARPPTPTPPTPAPATPIPPTSLPPTPTPPTPTPPTRMYPYPPMYIASPEFYDSPVHKATPSYREWAATPTYKASPDYTDTPKFEAGDAGGAVYKTSPTYKDTPLYQNSPEYKDGLPAYRQNPGPGTADFPPLYVDSPEYKDSPWYQSRPPTPMDSSPMYLESPEFKDAPASKASPPAEPVPVGELCFALHDGECLNGHEPRECRLTAAHTLEVQDGARADFQLGADGVVDLDGSRCRDSANCPAGSCALNVTVTDMDAGRTPAQLRAAGDACREAPSRCGALQGRGLVATGPTQGFDDDDDFPWGWFFLALMLCLLCVAALIVLLANMNKKKKKKGEDEEHRPQHVALEELSQPPSPPPATPPFLPADVAAPVYATGPGADCDRSAASGLSSRRTRHALVVDSLSIPPSSPPPAYVPPAGWTSSQAPGDGDSSAVVQPFTMNPRSHSITGGQQSSASLSSRGFGIPRSRSVTGSPTPPMVTLDSRRLF